MIARSVILFLLLVIIPYLYIDLRYLRHKSWWKRLLWWLTGIGMIAYTVYLALERDFIPSGDRIYILYAYLMLLGAFIIPMCTFMLCSLIGKGCSKLVRASKGKNSQQRSARNYGNLLGVISIPVVWFILFWGAFIGFNKFDVNHIEYESEAIPKAFDNYRIVLFSDAHVGSYLKHNAWVLAQAVDSINAQEPDMIVFTGDLQNIQPQDLYPHMDVLSKLKAKDGVFSVLGNHDYAEYVGCDDARKVANCRETNSLEKQMGWTLLLNEHRLIERNKAHIVLAGMENDGDGKHFPQKGDIDQTLEKVKEGDFILMLEHDPSAWRRKIIPDGRAQLTLSGHTHNMQFALFGWSPISLTGREVNGWYREGEQSLFVTAGLGGLIPFRFGATGEIVVVTLHSKD